MRIMSETTRRVYAEGKVATMIERQTAQFLPSDIFLWAVDRDVADPEAAEAGS